MDRGPLPPWARGDLWAMWPGATITVATCFAVEIEFASITSTVKGKFVLRTVLVLIKYI